MIEKLKEISKRYEEVSEELMKPEVVSDMNLYKKYMKEHKNLSPIVECFNLYEKAMQDEIDAKEMIENEKDKEFREMLEAEYKEAKEKIAKYEEELKILLLPKDINDDRNVIVEIRAGAGGDEAALFAAALYRMYTMYAESMGYKSEMMYANETGLGGYREVSFSIEGDGAYSKLKFESGVHRVQRVPDTESSGRIHTSTVTVAVLPEAEDVEIEINPVDLEIDTYRSGGAGGQHVNTTDSAVRITHKPTGVVVECQDERSQHKNREKAMKVLKTRLYDFKLQEQNSKIASERKSQVGTGDRSERIRTYNYPQGRVTDHRIGLSLYKLESFLNGDLNEMIEALITNMRAEMLKAGNTEE